MKLELANGIIRDMTPEEEAAFLADSTEILNLIIRKDKIAEIESHRNGLIDSALPGQGFTNEDLDTLRMVTSVFDNTSFSTNGLLVKDIVIYARTKINQAKTAPIAQVQAYDPSADAGWPS